jgi:hypothetical protein
MRHCNKKFALKWHPVRLKLEDSFRFTSWLAFTDYYRKEIQKLPSNGRFRLSPNGGAYMYVENEEDAVMIALMYG